MTTIQTLEIKIGSLDKRVSSLEKKFDSLENKVEAGFADMRTLITDSIDGLAIMFKENFDHIDKRFNQIDDRFDRIENVSIGGHERRIENLEDDIRSIKTKIGLNKN